MYVCTYIHTHSLSRASAYRDIQRKSGITIMIIIIIIVVIIIIMMIASILSLSLYICIYIYVYTYMYMTVGSRSQAALFRRHSASL